MILLDTHIVVWLLETPELLSRRATAAIEAMHQEDGLAISDKTLWELALLVWRGRIEVQVPLGDFLAEVERLFKVLPITAAVAQRAVQFSDRYPKDPNDRIIGATALANDLALITADKRIIASGEVPTLW